MEDLEEYGKKRDFNKTPEPGPDFSNSSEQPVFVVQKHWARRLHYDFRIEHKGVLKSWAVPKGLPENQKDRRLAVMVEDHPYEYKNFHGNIPKGHYGAGQVIIFDGGTYGIKGQKTKKEVEEEIEYGLKKGHLFVYLNGKILKGGFDLVKMQGKNWLLIKSKETPDIVLPMLAQTQKEPFDNEGWIFEIKWDGYRAISFLKDGQIKIKSRNGNPMDYFPRIENELKKIRVDAIFDGEAVALNSKDLPSFQLLQNYIKTQKGDILYYIFDIIYLNGSPLSHLPLLERKKFLKKIIPQSPVLKFVDHQEKNGKDFFQAARKAGLEGIMAKKSDSPYLAGRRSRFWLKIKTAKRQEMVIIGFTKPQKSRKHFGSLLLGYYKNNHLVYGGRCGSGFNEEMLHEIYRTIFSLITGQPPLEKIPKMNSAIFWVKPRLVCEVKFTEWTDEGLMRHPVFAGLRLDKNPKEVFREEILENKFEMIKISNPKKIFWPKDGYTKNDLVEYYKEISPVIFPHLKDRPMVLERFPNGISGKSFYQKNIPQNLGLPDFIKTKKIISQDGETNFIICQNEETIIYLANLGCVSMHPWNSTIDDLEHPDCLVLDYDAKQSTFKNAVKVVLAAHEILEKFGIKHLLKTSGGTGLHIYIPLSKKYTHEQAKNFAELLNIKTFSKTKKISTLERNPEKRNGKVYLDHLQNGRGKTLASAYSARPRPGAPVSTPIFWNEIEKIKPEDFNIKNIIRRLAETGDTFMDVLGPGINIEDILIEF